MAVTSGTRNGPFDEYVQEESPVRAKGGVRSACRQSVDSIANRLESVRNSARVNSRARSNYRNSSNQLAGEKEQMSKEYVIKCEDDVEINGLDLQLKPRAQSRSGQTGRRRKNLKELIQQFRKEGVTASAKGTLDSKKVSTKNLQEGRLSADPKITARKLSTRAEKLHELKRQYQKAVQKLNDEGENQEADVVIEL